MARACCLATDIALIALSASSARTLISRDTVGSDATGPYTPGSPRSTATSLNASPPSARDTARSRRILPGSWTANGFRHPASASDSPRSRPAARIVSVSRTPPAWATAVTFAVST